MEKVNLSENEKSVLTCLFENTDSLAERCIAFDWIIGDTKLTRKEVKNACKLLREKELVCFYRGLMTEDGEVAGSGYCISAKGQALINPCDVCGETAEFDWYEDTLGNQVIKSQSVKRIRLCNKHYEKTSNQSIKK